MAPEPDYPPARRDTRLRASRIGPMAQLPGLLTGFGVAPSRAFAAAGTAPGLFDNPENRIDGQSLCRLLAACVNLTGREDFGLLLGRRFALRDFGILGELMLNSATVGEAMRVLIMHLHFYDRAAIPVMLRMTSASVFLGYALPDTELEDTRQWQDCAIVIAHRMLRQLCGPQWHPRAVQFAHRRPASAAAYRRIFGAGVHFDAALSGLSFDAAWLEHPIAGADPGRCLALTESLRTAQSGWPIGLVEEVQCVLHQLLPGGSASATSVAQLFGCSERTLRQKLQARGVCLQQLLAKARFELACHLLQDTDLPMSRIAESLCYSDAAVFSRAFHHWTGMSPRAWRTSNRKF
jgi:AraC-like DNA-binding protein